MYLPPKMQVEELNIYVLLSPMFLRDKWMLFLIHTSPSTTEITEAINADDVTTKVVMTPSTVSPPPSLVDL